MAREDNFWRMSCAGLMILARTYRGCFTFMAKLEKGNLPSLTLSRCGARTRERLGHTSALLATDRPNA
ncbi:hypothetical protein ID866_5210 [Astraeus odoratus]|nr:hypothetical protein ID866_5210 [Astraeus odoratus]